MKSTTVQIVAALVVAVAALAGTAAISFSGPATSTPSAPVTPANQPEPQPVSQPESKPIVERCIVRIDGMHCQGCAELISRELAKLPGVVQAEVSFKRGQAELGLSEELDPDAVKAGVKKAGYEAGAIEPLPQADG
jgi:copper chaperone CopZ